MFRIRRIFPSTVFLIGVLSLLLLGENATSSETKVEKKKVEVLGQVFKKYVDKLRESPGEKVDLVFLVDSSGSVGAANFLNELTFVKKLLADFPVSYNQTRVVVITYSDEATRNIDHMSQASPSNHKCSLLKKELPNIVYTGGSTYTLGAVMEAQNVLATSRSDSSKAVLLLTDGYSNGGDPRPAAEILKSRGVPLFTFGIQNGNVQELYEMASEPKKEHTYILDSFEEFEALARRALHVDVHAGEDILQDPTACSSLCDQGKDCCDRNAQCTCGTYTGYYVCACRKGFYGSGLKGDCKPCPAGTYRDMEGPSDITGCKSCPDPHMFSPPQSTGIHQCYCQGRYIQSGMKCKIQECPRLSPPKNGYFIGGTCERATKTTCRIRCDPGYNPKGSLLRRCSEDGTWTGTDATCIMKTCKKLMPPMDGEMNCSSDPATIHTQCTFMCNPGYQLAGSRRRTCQPSIVWNGMSSYCEPIFCPPLSSQINGFVKPMFCIKYNMTFGTTCDFGCNPGYRLKGPFNTTCQDKGIWSKKQKKVRCIVETCKKRKSPTNGEMSCSSDPATIHTQCIFTCNPGYHLKGSRIRTCQPGSVWDGERSHCKGRKCPKLSAPQNGYFVGDVCKRGVNNTCTIRCNSDYVVRGTSLRQCMENATWSGTDATCVMKTCKKLMTPLNGEMNCSSDPATIHTQCTFTCNQGYQLTGSRRRTCQPGSAWDGISSSCELSSISNTISHSAATVVEDDRSISSGNRSKRQVKKIQTKRENVRKDICINNTCKNLKAISERSRSEQDEKEANWRRFQRKKHGVAEVDRQARKDSPIMDDVFKGLIQSAESGDFYLNGEEQFIIAAIRLSEDPEFTCEPGSVLVLDHCLKCPMGTFFNVILKNCQSCPAGSFQPKEGQVACLVCPDKTSTRIGQAKSDEDCKAMCLPGSYSKDALEPCVTCSLGEYQDEYGSSSCSSCPFGTTTWRRGSWIIEECKPACPPGQVSETGLEPCLPCPLNYFQSEAEQKECFKCPGDSYTLNTSSTSLFNCIGISKDWKATYADFERLLINDCFSAPCKNGGLCSMDEYGYVCTCPLGYAGEQCEEEINECLNQPCPNSATCEDKLAGFKCVCSEGFEGDLCEIDINECDPNPCKNDAFCLDLINSFRCICESGFAGKTCQENIDDCEIAPCSQSSTCIDGISNYTCVCPSGFKGIHCYTEINECDSSPCIHGICSDLVNGFKCNCEKGYSGEKCDVDIDYCESQPCENNGTCIDWLHGFSCICLPGYTGKSCDTVMSTDFVLEFPTPGIVDYAYLENLPRAVDAMTVCFWMKTKNRENYGTPFSYATETYDNAFTLTDYNGFVFYVNGEKAITDVTANDGKWHMICVVWRSTEGTWAIFKDSVSVDSGKGISEGRLIESDGVFVLGQEQDQKGGKYSASESFVGDLFLLNVWGRALSNDTLTSLYHECGRYVGDIRSWPDFQSGVMGQLKLKSSTFCVGCEALSSPQNGKILQYGSRGGDVATIVCNEGYELYTGGKERTCLWNGKWSGYEPECRVVSCGLPSSLLNGEMKGSNTNYGDVYTYACDKGFKLVGSVTRKCGTDGKWTGTEPQCQIIKCPGQVPMENGIIISHLGSYLPTNRVSYTCEKGYQMEGPSYQVCGGTGSWEGSPPSCQPTLCDTLPKVTHGTVTRDTADSSKLTASLTCNFGYRIKGNSAILCEGGSWALPLPKCVSKECENPPPVENGNIEIRMSMEGQQAKYKCNLGFVIEGPSLLTCCTEFQVWGSSTWPKCVPQWCPIPEVPPFGKIPQKERWAVGDEVLYECDLGYSILGNPKKTCVQGFEEGYWEGQTPTCEAIICPPLNFLKAGTFKIIHNGVENKALSVQDEVNIFVRRKRSADLGFPSIGHSSSNYDELEDFGSSPNKQISFLMSLGDFDFRRRRSRRFDYSKRANGGYDVFASQISKRSDQPIFDGPYTYNTTAEYECKTGFRLIGSRIRRCSEYGDWHQPEPHCYRQHCPGIPSIVNGYFTYLSSGELLTIEFHCNVGFQLSGESEIFCQADGTWSGEIPHCEEAKCNKPRELENGTVTYNSTNIDAVALYDCFQGFFLKGNFERYCQPNGFWNGSLPRCLEIACKAPSVIEKGYIYYKGNLNVGSLVEYGCNDCYKLNGTPLRECQLDESWSLEEPSCELIKCDALPSELENGKIIGGDNSCGSLVEYECNPGYETKGLRKASCMNDSKWTSATPSCERISCGEPPPLLNGKRNGSSLMFSDQVQYECNEGYIKTGNDILTCTEKRTWLGDIPECRIVNCTKPEGPSNGRVRVNGLYYGASVKVVCDTGFKIEGDSTLTCQANGKWDKKMASCSPLICPPAPRPKHSFYNSTELYFESFSYLLYKCHEGYTTTMENTILECNAKGEWKGDFIKCDPVDCGELKSLEYGKIEGSKYTLGETLNFTCLEGYEMVGDNKTTCQPNGRWSGIPTCRKIKCGSPPKNEFGNITIDDSEVDFKISASYQCHDGYILRGSSELTCEDDGHWSGIAPICDPVVCPEPSELVNAEFTGNIYQFRHSINFTCNNGYTMQGSPVLNCLENGTWSSSFPVCEMIVCDKVEDITNATWKTIGESEVPIKTEALTASQTTKTLKKEKLRSKSSKSRKIVKLTSLLETHYENFSYRFGHKIEYTCNEGYFKTTTGILECTREGWSSHPPQCHPITCPLPISITNGRVIGDDMEFGSTLRYECDEGYDLFGVSIRTCQANKEWTDIEPYCRPKECSRPAQIINGKTIVESIKYQAIISYVCDPGFRLEGEETRVCQSNKNWSGERPDCIEVFCNRPKAILYAKIDVTTLKVGGKVNYQCMEGYSVEGKETLNCQSDGLWDVDPPKCHQVDCGPAPSNEHLILEGNATVYAAKVVYSCERGYKMEGEKWTTCLQSGRWKNRAPSCNLASCVSPPEPDNGFIVKEVLYVGNEVTFDCNPGWKISGEATLKCTEDGTWSSSVPACSRISCGPPELAPHVEYSGSNFMYEGEIVYSCEKGYLLRGKRVAKCTEVGTWTDNATVCEPISCGFPPIVENSYATFKIPEHSLPHHFGSVLTYKCNEGYALEGSPNMICEAFGKWIGSKELPRCVEMPCGPPPVVPHATALEDNHSESQSVTYTCDPGYILIGESSSYCSPGRWKELNISCNPVKCCDPPIPTYGKITISSFTLGSLANYSCVEGYVLDGNPSVVCGVDGLWVGDKPNCQPVDCGEPKSPRNGKASFASTLLGNKVTYHCDDGYELKGGADRVCSHDGSWSAYLPRCYRISCGELQPPLKGFIVGAGQLFGDQVKFTCDKGHVLIGNETSVCQKNGKWSVAHPRCEVLKCGRPVLLFNAEPLKEASEDFMYGDKVSYSCQKGHVQRGNLSSECRNDGMWSTVTGRCSKISCGKPKTKGDGAIIGGRSFYYNAKVKISCPPGTKPKGSTFLTCLSNGSWSGEASCVNWCDNTCINGGFCTSRNACSCPLGFTGDKCQYDHCPLPCLNGGVCTGPHYCLCPPGYTGNQCQTTVCQHDCGPYGKCIGPNVCLCQSGEIAKSCSEYTDNNYPSHHDVTHFSDWDIAALRRSLRVPKK